MALPKRFLIRSTDGDLIDLLNPRGFCIREWIPGVAALKDAGVRISSSSMDSSHLVAGGYGNVVETVTVSASPEVLASRLEDLQALLWKAEAYALQPWQRNAVYLEVEMYEDAGIRYSPLVSASYQFGDCAFGRRQGLLNNTMQLERGPYWLGAPPGSLLGPFSNMAKNPSFEHWSYEGVTDALPDGWAEIADGAFPATRESRREERITAGAFYSLAMEFSGAGAAGQEWYLWQNVVLKPSTTYTLRVWIQLQHGGGAGELFFIRITDNTGAVLFLNQTYAADQAAGFVHLQFDTDRRAWHHCILEIGFLEPGTSAGTTVYVDRLFLAEGEWDEHNWPGNFYMTSSVVYPFWDPSGWLGITWADPLHQVNHVDFTDLPGDAEAETRFIVKNILGEDALILYVSPIIELAVFLEKDSLSEERARDPMGPVWPLAMSDSVAGNTIEWGLSSDDAWETIYSFQVNGPDVTELLNGSFRVLARMSLDSEQLEDYVWVRLCSWVGEPVHVKIFDSIQLYSTTHSAPGGPRAVMVNLTPNEALAWSFGVSPGDTAALGFYVQVLGPSWYEGFEILLDCILLGEVTQGGVICDFDPAVMHYGQALILDSTDPTRPVQKGMAQEQFIPDRIVTGNNQVTPAARVFNNELFVSRYDLAGLLNSDILGYTPLGWTREDLSYGGVGTSPPVRDFEVFNNVLRFVTDGGQVWNYESVPDAYTLMATIAGTPDLSYIQAFGSYCYIAASDNHVYRWDGTVAAPVSVYGPAAQEPLCMEVYKHQLWVGYATGLTAVYDAGGWAAGAAVPGGVDVVWLKTFQDRLYAARSDNAVYRWDGDTWTLVRAAVAADDLAQELKVFNDRLYLLTGGATQDVACLFVTSDGTTWHEAVALQDTVNEFLDAMTVESYCGRLFLGLSHEGAQLWTVGWHVPVLSKILFPEHTGSVFQFSPHVRNRVWLAWTVHHGYRDIDPRGYWEVEASDNVSQAAAELWFNPRWRTLRGD